MLLSAAALFVSILFFSEFQTHNVNPLSTTSPWVQTESLNELEQQVLALINGSRAYDYDLELENIALRHNEFRSGGSPGAEETAIWVKAQFVSCGLNASLEPFEFTNWNLTDKPALTIDEDGNLSTTDDQVSAGSFLPAHLSWPTSPGGIFADLVVLPLPPAGSRVEFGLFPINDTEWAVNTTGRIVLVGKEVRWSGSYLSKLNEKLVNQAPAALIYTWWYDWMAFTPPLMNSAEGKTYWNLQLPVGSVDYYDGLWIRNQENTANVSASFSIQSTISMGTHYNVVGKLGGYKNPEKYVIISSHYDTVTCCGFCDNGAGTAGVIELAKVLSDAVQNGTYRPKYTLLFVAFTDEEFWLVGSINYVKQHKSEMPNVVAVINLDCIGSDDFYFTETDPDNGFDLDEIVNLSAQDVGISAFIEPPGGSDHETFRNPQWANDLYLSYWNLDANISDATPVKSSIILVSEPLLYSDLWYSGKPGYIHTSYDNSTSTQTLNWVEVGNLEDHIKVAALTVLRVSPNPSNLGDTNGDGIVDIFDAIILAGAFGSQPSDPTWNANADINKDNVVDIYDAIILSAHYGETNT